MPAALLGFGGVFNMRRKISVSRPLGAASFGFFGAFIMAQVDMTEQFHLMSHAVGEALYAWQSVERALFAVYLAPFEKVPQNLLAITFYHIQSFKERVSLVDQTLNWFTSPEDYARWNDKTFQTSIKDRIAERNRLAHYEIREVKSDPCWINAVEVR